MLLGLAAGAGFGAGDAWAGSVREQQAVTVWRMQAECGREAFAKFPDYTRESNANRDRATRECEIKNNLPLRAPVGDSPVKVIPGNGDE